MLQFERDYERDGSNRDPNPPAAAPIAINGNLLFPNGVEYRVDNSLVSWMVDRNGNKTSLSYNSGVSSVLCKRPRIF